MSINGWLPERLQRYILPVPEAVVRWSRGQEFAVENMVIEPHTQARLQHYVTRIIDGSVGGDGERARLKHV